MSRWIVAGVFTLLLLGCAGVPLNKITPSGKPEGFYQTTKEKVRDALVEKCNKDNALVSNADENSVLCSKSIEGMRGALVQVLIGNSYSTPPVAKIKFTLAQRQNGVQVWADMWMETQMAMGQIRQQRITDNGSVNHLQEVLDSLNPE